MITRCYEILKYNNRQQQLYALFAHANPCWFQQLTERLRTVERNVIFFSRARGYHAVLSPLISVSTGTGPLRMDQPSNQGMHQPHYPIRDSRPNFTLWQFLS
jgi:hypothetical protein